MNKQDVIFCLGFACLLWAGDMTFALLMNWKDSSRREKKRMLLTNGILLILGIILWIGG